jgi:hypothetical protein
MKNPEVMVAFGVLLWVAHAAEILDSASPEKLRNDPETSRILAQNLKKEFGDLQPIPVEALFQFLPPDKRTEAIRNAVAQGLILKIPEVLDVLDTPELRINYLRSLPEPIPHALLDKMAELAPSEPSDEVRGRYAAWLYRYGREQGIQELRSILADGESRQRMRAALVLALNQEDSASEEVIAALEREPHLDTDLLVALGSWPDPAVQRFLADGFQRRRAPASAWALSVALGNQSEFAEEIGILFEEAPLAETGKLMLAAALARLAADRNHNPGIDFIIDELEAQREGGSALIFVVDALAYSDSSRGRDVLVKMLAGQKFAAAAAQFPPTLGRTAALVSESFDLSAEISLASFLASVPHELYPLDRDRLLRNILEAEERYALQDALQRIAPVSFILRMHKAPLKLLPNELLLTPR